MKKGVVKMGLIAIMLVGFTTINACANQPETELLHGEYKTEEFKVFGNCGMCKKTIEGAFKDVKGVKKAVWNVESKTMSVTFDAHVISLNDVKKKITAVGYDTEEFKASEETYNNLPGCCQYDRELEESEEN
jgi:mercuric ion binding protein